jgi:myo-inositol 2-dehydrogenase / D-chiro-inositol 1-dehydrogenase
LKICYIGAGNFSNTFIYPQLARHEVELAAVCDLVEEKAQAAAAMYGFARVYTDFEKMLDEQQPDAVFCIGAKNMHYTVGIQVIERGFPVYVQKPPAATVEQTREMAALAEAKKTVCHVGFNMRSSGAVAMTKKLLEGDEFGAPTLLICRYGLFAGKTWWAGIHDQHCHAIDAVLYLLGGVESVHVEPLPAEGVRGYVAAMVMENGAVATLNTTSEQDIRDEFFYFEVTGRGQHCVISHDGDLRYHRPEGDDLCLRAGTYFPSRLLDHFGYVSDVANFLAAARGEEADRCPVGDTIGTMELVDEIYRQCRERGGPE